MSGAPEGLEADPDCRSHCNLVVNLRVGGSGAPEGS